jgi:hypothetical protein
MPALPAAEAARDDLAVRMFGPAAGANVAPQPNSAAAVAAAQASAPTPVVQSAPVAPAHTAPTKTRGKQKAQAASVTKLKQATLDELRTIYDTVPDATFFGSFHEAVTDLRKELTADPDGYDGDAVATFVIEARQFIAEAVEKEGKVPLVVEMLHFGRYDYMFLRMMPDKDLDFILDAATALQAKIAAEQAGTDA